jgi:ubiquitin carboxyl-terminal hydrolase 1
MNNPYRNDRRATFAYPQNPRNAFLPDSPTSTGGLLIAALAGVYVLFKVLDLLGYPVWLWLHQAAQMAYDEIPAFGNLFGDASDSEDDTQNSGGVLGRLGLNNSGFLQKSMRGFTGALSKSYNDAPPGLGNWDNSCYQNSVIQGMASLPSLRDYLSKTTTEYKALDSDSTNGALLDLITRLNNPDNHGQQFWIKGKLKSMSTFQQQDAQEYYSKIMDELDKEVRDVTKSKRQSTASWLLTAKSLGDSRATAAKNESTGNNHQEENTKTSVKEPERSPVPSPLDGLLAQRVGCITCGYTEGLSMIPFNCVTVPLGSRSYNYDIRECLDEYTNLELIEGVECAKCTVVKSHKTLSNLASKNPMFASKLQVVQEVLDEEDFDDKTLIKKCGVAKKNWVQSTKSRQAVIARAPKSLVLHVNRSIFDENTGMQYKNTATVLYPKVLDLGTWCLGSSPSKSESLDESVEEWPRDPTKSMLGDADAEPVTNSPFQYTLKAAVTHFGSHGNGHYTCYRNQPFTVKKDSEDSEEESKNEDKQEDMKAGAEQWWRISDENVTAISEDTALRQGGVFMLFYERIDTDSNPLPPSELAPGETNTTTVPEHVSLPSQKIHTSGLAHVFVGHPIYEVALPIDDDEHVPLSLPASPAPQASASRTGNLSHELGESDLYESVRSLAPASTAAADAYLTPPPDSPRTIHQSQPQSREDTELELSENESVDAPSTTLTSDDDADDEVDDTLRKGLENLQVHHGSPPSPQWMRTAGDASDRGQGERQSLTMVAPT